MSSNLALASNTSQSVYEPWPNQQWTWPTWTYPTTTIISNPPAEEYANELEVDQHEHDATLRFYRRRGKGGRTLVKEVTIPSSVLGWLQGTES